MSLTAVIVHYFEVRRPNLLTIVESLLGGTRPPEQILIWNNDPAPLTYAWPDQVRVIDSWRNVGCQGRFLAALTAETDRVLFQDNDLAVGSETVARLEAVLEAHPGHLVTGVGRLIGDGSYKTWPGVDGRKTVGVTSVPISLGRLELISRELLFRVLREFAFGPESIMDDLLFSSAAERTGVKRLVPGLTGAQAFRNLPTGGVGLSITNKSDYYEARARVARSLWDRHSRFDVSPD